MVAHDQVRFDEGVRQILEGITDPEIPVLNVLEMGIVRSATVVGGEVEVRITPTYSGCPAMHAIQQEIETRLRAAGYASVRVETVFDEVWTTDWMDPGAREKLRRYGIAPPEKHSGTRGAACPRCASSNTALTSYFGSTACKSLHFCKECSEPFEAFKCI